MNEQKQSKQSFMMVRIFTFTAALLLLLASCGPTDEQKDFQEDPATADAGRLEALYNDINNHYEQMMGLYREHQGQMPPDVQQMYAYMQQMHDQVADVHHRMMQDGMHGPGMMRGGMGMGPSMHALREWDRQMLGMHEAMMRLHREDGWEEMAAFHEQMTEWYRQALERTPDEGAPPEGPETPEGVSGSGAALFEQHCTTCHGPEGGGLAGVFPPLAGSSWVTGEAETPIRIVLHGLEGPIEVAGRSYSGGMPGFGARLSNEEIAALLTYARSSWGNDASAVAAQDVRNVRQAYSGRAQPWSAPDLE